MGNTIIFIAKECIFDNIALYFECRINTPSACFFGDFAHWVRVVCISKSKIQKNGLNLVRYIREVICVIKSISTTSLHMLVHNLAVISYAIRNRSLKKFAWWLYLVLSWILSESLKELKQQQQLKKVRKIGFLEQIPNVFTSYWLGLKNGGEHLTNQN